MVSESSASSARIPFGGSAREVPGPRVEVAVNQGGEWSMLGLNRSTLTPSDGARVGLVLAGRAGLVSRCVASVAFCLRALRPTIR